MATSATSFAQEGPRKGNAAQGDATQPPGQLQDIIVTARRVEERAESVPIAITVLSGADLDKRAVNEITDLQYSVPSLVIEREASGIRTNIALRGQSAGTNGSGNGFNPVDILFADVPQAQQAQQVFFDIESVQVLKGPQGVAFGRNTTGGAILIYPARPTNQFEGRVTVGYGSYDSKLFEGIVNIPVVSDKLLFRAAVHLDRSDGWVKNIYLNSTLNGEHQDYARLTMQFNPADWLKTTTIASYQRSTGTALGSRLTYFNPLGTVGFLYGISGLYQGPLNLTNEIDKSLNLPRYTVNSDFDGLYYVRDYSIINNITADVASNLRLKNISSILWSTEREDLGDFDSTPLPAFQFGGDPKPYPTDRTITEEFQVQGKWFHSLLQTVTGVYFASNKPVRYGRLSTGFSPNPYVVFDGLVISPRPTVPIKQTGFLNTDVGIFARGTLALDTLAEGLSLTVGGRYTWNKRVTNPGTLTLSPSTGVITTGLGSDVTYKGYNYEFTLDYQVSPNKLLYITHRRGYKGGGTNVIPTVDLDTPFGRANLIIPSEIVKDVEVGAKGDFKLGSVPLRTDIAVYRQWYTDLTQPSVVTAPSGQSATINVPAGSADIAGLEANVTIIPARPLTITFAYAYTDAKFRDTNASRPFRRFPNVPRHKMDATATYQVVGDRGLGTVTLGVTASYQSSKFANQSAYLPETKIDHYALVNFQFNWRNIGHRGFDAQAYVNNAFDAHYFVGGDDLSQSFGFARLTYGVPRVAGAKLTYNF